MLVRTLILAAALALPGAGMALAADHDHGSMQSAVKLPEACKAATAGKDAMMKDMQGHMSQAMQGMGGQMTETQKGLQQAMMSMNGPMMQGMMAKDADVAWICAMIPHHQGAIDMARAGLKGADNAESKRLAEKTIEEQEKSIKELVAWLDKNAKTEGNQ